MCEYSSVDGFANDWHLVHLGSRAVGGAALVIQEATAVSPEGRISPDDLGLWKEAHIEKLKSITTFIRHHHALPGIQLAHAGRKASFASPWKGSKQIKVADGGWNTVSPSAVPFYNGNEAPLELDQPGIEKVIRDFTKSARFAVLAGYQVLEIHAAHGYLLHEFLSPLTNQRSDAYGGSFENRIRLLLRVVEAVQTVWPEELPLFVRISATDWAEQGGWDIESSVKLAAILKNKGVDLIDCSSGGVMSGIKIPFAPGYHVPFAERIKRETGIPTGVVGLITEAKQAEEIVATGKADLVFIARQALRDPYFPLHAAKELGVDLHWPSQYERAKPV
jgi:2,4-dienoyl-CoA reductase-like NADH-dependent reductase (Old Yellow Enzyme family)